MYFSHNRIILCVCLLGSLLLSLSGCSLRIGEKPTQDKEIRVTGPGCLDAVGEDIRLFFLGDLPDERIHSTFVCLDGVFEQFFIYARGYENEESFTAAELKTFLQPFLKKRTISAQLLEDMLELKGAVVGGPKNRLSRNDIVRSRDLLVDIEVILKTLNPHMKLISRRHTIVVQSDLPQLQAVDDAVTALMYTAQKVASIVDLSRQDYDLQKFESLLTGVRDFVGWEQSISPTRTPEVWANLLYQLKRMMAGGPTLSVEPGEWRPLIVNLASWYGLVLRFVYDLKHNSLLVNPGLERLNVAVNQAFSLIQGSVELQKNRIIEFGSSRFEVMRINDDVYGLNGLLDALEDADFLPFGLKSRSLQVTVRALVTKVFTDLSVSPVERRVKGIDTSTVAQLRLEFERWMQIQKYLVQTFNSPSAPHSLTSEFIRRDLAKNNNQNSLFFLEDMKRILENHRPLYRANQTGVMLVEKAKATEFEMAYGFKDMSYKNLLRFATQLIFRGYSWSKSKYGFYDAQMSEDEFNAFYFDVRDIAVDLKIMDPRSTSAGRRSYVEGNIFTYVANGAQSLGFDETMELFAMLISGGNLAKQIYRDFYSSDGSICQLGPKDPFGDSLIQRHCVRDGLIKNYHKYISSMPGLLSVWDQWGLAEKSTHIDRLLTAAFSKDSKEEWIELAELSTLTVIQHYIEVVFTRFNHNGDLILDETELEPAEPVMRGIIKILAQAQCMDLGDWKARQVFWYILRNNEIPNFYSLPGIIWHWVWGSSVSLDRAALTDIFAAMMSRAAAAKASGPVQCD